MCKCSHVGECVKGHECNLESLVGEPNLIRGFHAPLERVKS